MKGKGFGFRPRVTMAGASAPHSNPLTDRSNKETPRLHASIVGTQPKKTAMLAPTSSVSANRFEKKKVSFVGKRDGNHTTRTPVMSARKMPQNASTSQFSSYHDTSLQTSYTGFLKSETEDIQGDSQNRPDLIEYGADMLLQKEDYRPEHFGTPEIEQPKFCASPEFEKSPKTARTPNTFNPSASMSLARSTFLNHTTLQEARAMRSSVDPRSSMQNHSALFQPHSQKEIRQSKPRFQSLIKKPPGRASGLYQSASKTPTSRFTPNKMQISVNDKSNFEDVSQKRFASTTKQTSLASPSMRFSSQLTYQKEPQPIHNTNLLSRTSFKSKITKQHKPNPEPKVTELVTEFERGSPKEKGFVANPGFKSHYNRHKISLIKEESRDSTLTQLQTSPSPPKVQMPSTSYSKRQPNQFTEISPLPTEETPFAKELKADCEDFHSFDLDLTNSDMPFSTNLPQNLLNEFDDSEHVLPQIEESVSFSRNVLETSTPSKKLSEIGQRSKDDALSSAFEKPMDQIVPVHSLSRSKMYSSNHSSLVELGPSLANQLKDLVDLCDEPELTEEERRNKLALKIQRMWRRFKAVRAFPQLKLDKRAQIFYKHKSRVLLQQIVDVRNALNQTFRENALFVKQLRYKYKGSAKLLPIIRIQLFWKRKMKKTMSVRRFKAKLRGLVEGWRVRRIMRLTEIDSIVKGILDLKNLIAEMSAEKETKHSKAFLEQIKKDLPNRIKEFNDAYQRAYEEHKWEISPSEDKKAQMRRTMKGKKQKFNQTAKYNPPRLGSKRPHMLKHNGISKMSETTASLNLGISSDFNEDSFSQMNQTMASGGMDSFLGLKRGMLAPKTCREKKNIRISEADPFHSQRGGVSLKQTSPVIQEINISPLSTKAAALHNSSSLRRLEVKPSPKKEGAPFSSELHTIIRDLEKVYGLAMRQDSSKDQCDAELENILLRIRADYASLWR